MCVPVMETFLLSCSETGIIAKFIIWQGWVSFLCATPDDHKTQYIDRPYRLGGGGLHNSLRKTIFVICYFGLK